MSRLSAKSRTTTERSREKNYKLYAMNFYGDGLKMIKDEFIEKVKSGLRRRVCVIDIDEEIKAHTLGGAGDRASRANRANQRTRKSVQDYDLAKGKIDPFFVTMAAIERCRRQYTLVTQALALEKKFDLLSYWRENMNVKSNAGGGDPSKSAKRKSKPLAADKLAKSAKVGKSSVPALQAAPLPIELDCIDVKPKQHNRVGGPTLYSTVKYIQDEPMNNKLFIILVGNFEEQYYQDLLKHGEPLQAVIHFLPEESTYDFMIRHTEYYELMIRSLSTIQRGICTMRKVKYFKTVGNFQEKLPVISKCLAQKYSDKIYAELCWYIYDVESMYQDYLTYYFEPFEQTNVEMPAAINLNHMYEVVQALSFQGHFLKQPMPAIGSDLATIIIYMEGLLNIFGEPEQSLSEIEIALLSAPIFDTMGSRRYTERIDELIDFYQYAFSSITRVKHFERIFVEENNRLLNNLIAYADHELFNNIYFCCLEYNLLRKYIITSYVHNTFKTTKCNEEYEPINLPRYIKYYASMDTVLQRLDRLSQDYDDYEADEIQPGFRLFAFRRVFNEIFENEKTVVVPTRLCFRDFTLFQMDEFYKSFVSPEKRQSLQSHLHSRASREMAEYQIAETLFVRPRSLKWQKILVEQSRAAGSQSMASSVKGRPDRGGRLSRTTGNSLSMKKPLLGSSNSDYIGLPPNHDLLKGYNLDDVRQEIMVRTSKYHFEEGSFQLYEERWCFDDINKYLQLRFNDTKFHLRCERERPNQLSKNVRITTKNDVSIRVHVAENECAKAVINYPNGLAIYHQETYAEQIWYPIESYNNERRRIYTPHGAVIVFYQMEDMILVMRYNGEVYYLYQYELDLGGEEEQLGEMSFGSTLRNSSSTFSTDPNKPGSSDNTRDTEKKGRRRKKQTQLPRTRKRAKSRQKHDDLYLSESISLPSKSPSELLVEGINNEIRYLTFLSTEYNLSYLHMKLVTSMGRSVTICHTGLIFENMPLYNEEWHDYNLDESYSMRQDHVKMIWTQDVLKCYHADGTVFTTKTQEGIELFDYFESEIGVAESSSHMEETSNTGASSGHRDTQGAPSPAPPPPPPPTTAATIVTATTASTRQPPSTGRRSTATRESQTRNIRRPSALKGEDYKEYLVGEIEEHIEEDPSYVTYACDSWLMQHKRYAAIYICKLSCVFDGLNCLMEIYTADQVRLQFTKEVRQGAPPMTGDLPYRTYKDAKPCADYTFSEENSMKSNETASRDIDSQDGEEEESDYHLISVINLWFGDELGASINNETVVINAMLTKCSDKFSVIKDTLELMINFDILVVELFHNLVATISTFKNYYCSKFEELFFMEKCDDKCQLQGFEFYNHLPKLQKYNYQVSNTITEFCALETVEQKMENKYDWYDVDMFKFPRFRNRRKPRPDPLKDFPMVLSVNVYVRIPRLLRSSERVKCFMEPFDNINFKRTRAQIKEALDFYLRPNIWRELKRLWSHNNWRLNLEENRRKLFIQEQRIGLYSKMLKCKKYPKYHKYMKDYQGHVKFIPFFEFVITNCVGDPVELDTVLKGGDDDEEVQLITKYMDFI